LCLQCVVSFVIVWVGLIALSSGRFFHRPEPAPHSKHSVLGLNHQYTLGNCLKRFWEWFRFGEI
jgi:hypothetical protein